MNSKRKLKPWVKDLMLETLILLLLISIVFIVSNINKNQKEINNFIKNYVCNESPFNRSCYYE